MTKIVSFILVDLLSVLINDNSFVTTRGRTWAFQLSFDRLCYRLHHWTIVLPKFEFLVDQFRMRNGNKCPCLLLQIIKGVSILM